MGLCIAPHLLGAPRAPCIAPQLSSTAGRNFPAVLWVSLPTNSNGYPDMAVVVCLCVYICVQIAALLDDGSLRIEGIMPGGSRSAYTLPLDVYCFGSSEAVRGQLQQRLGWAGEARAACAVCWLAFAAGCMVFLPGAGGGSGCLESEAAAGSACDGARDCLQQLLQPVTHSCCLPHCCFITAAWCVNCTGIQLQVMSLEQALASQAAGQQAAAGARAGASSSRGGGGAAAAAAATVTLAPTVMEASLNRMFEGVRVGLSGVCP